MEPDKKCSFGKSAEFSYGITQLPGKADEDRVFSTLNHAEQNVNSIVSFGVFDGHGGCYAASLCSTYLHSNIVTKYAELYNNSPLEPSIEKTDLIFCEAVRLCTKNIDTTIRKESNSGSTMLSLFFIKLEDGSHRVYCPWIGDSRCVMLKENSLGVVTTTLLSEDHKPSLQREKQRIELRKQPEWKEKPIEANCFTFRHDELDEKHFSPRNCHILPTVQEEQKESEVVIALPTRLHDYSFIARRTLENNNDQQGILAVFGCYGLSLAMTRSIGDRAGPRSCVAQPDITAVTIQPNEHARFILASDGLWDVATESAVQRVGFSSRDALKTANKLAIAAWNERFNRHIRKDDISVIVIDVNFENIPLSLNNSSCLPHTPTSSCIIS